MKEEMDATDDGVRSGSKTQGMYCCPIAGHLHDIQGSPGEALRKLSIVFWEMADSHAALPIERLHVVHQEQRAQPCCCVPCNPFS